jgi:hypothetical protein
MDSAGTRSDWISGTAAAPTGVGMLARPLRPAIPLVVLTIVAVLPLALSFIAVASIAATLTRAWLGSERPVRASAGWEMVPDALASSGRRRTWRPATTTTPWAMARRPGPPPC